MNGAEIALAVFVLIATGWGFAFFHGLWRAARGAFLRVARWMRRRGWLDA